MAKIKRFFECYVPVTRCNFSCDYCYVIQNQWELGKNPVFKYTPEQIGEALTQERLGGVCYFSICGGGETLLPKEMPEIILAILKQGHFVNITNNGTVTKAFERIAEIIPPNLLKHLHFAFSLHFLELRRLNMLERFAKNVNFVKNIGCSFVVQFNLYDGYEPYLDEIKCYCLENFGALPQVALTRLQMPKLKRHTSHSDEEYYKIGATFNSKLFDFTNLNFLKRHREFCYAGDWTFVLELSEGILKKCYGNGKGVNIFANPKEKIKFEAVGHFCNGKFCQNSSHFLSLGAIPSIYKDITYADLRNRPEANWYNDEAIIFFNSKLKESNKEYSLLKKIQCDIKECISVNAPKISRRMHKFL